MNGKIILSNNPLLKKSEGGCPVRTVDEYGLTAVIDAALTLAQSGYKLLSTPLPPNLPMIRAPYRSLLLKKNDRQYDARGIIKLQQAKERLETLGTAGTSASQHEDAAFIDREFLFKALEEIGGL